MCAASLRPIRDACLGAAPILDAARDTLAEHPAALEDVLRQVLQGPCAQAGTGQPILLVLDDVERILEEPRGGRAPWRVQPTIVTRHDWRDALFLLAVLAHTLLTLLGKASQELGMDRMLGAMRPGQ